jgi:signal transduction histidine kinase
MRTEPGRASSLIDTVQSDREMVRRVRAMDWSRTPLGPMDGWPHALRVAADLCLHTRFPMFIWWGPELINIYNDGYAPILGTRHPDALGGSAPRIWAEIWDTLKPEVEAVMARGQATWNEQVHLRVQRHGFPEDAYFTWSYSPIPDDDGAIGGLLATVSEDTDRVRAHQELAATQRRLDSALIAGEVGTFEWDIPGDRLRGDPNFARIFALRLDATGSAPLADYLEAVHPDDQARVGERVQHTIVTGEAYEAEYRIINRGDVRWVIARGKVERDGDGRVSRFPGVVLDITERKRVEEERERLLGALELERSRLGYVFQRAPAFLAVLRGPEHVFELANDAYYELVGRRDLLGHPVREALPEVVEQGFIEMLDGVLDSGRPVIGREQPIRLARSAGAEPEERFVDFSYLPLLEAEGGASGVIAHGTDVTDHVLARREVERLLGESERARDEAETARREAEAANRAKADFLAAMSHELRTPLNAIGGYVELLDMGVHGPLSDAQRASLTRVTANQRHLLTLINDVLAFAKLEAGQVEFDLRPLPVVDLLNSVEPLVGALASTKGIALRIREGGAPLRAVGDEERVRQILLNLVGNAIKYTPAGGCVELSGERDGPEVAIRVRDSGPGISVEQQQRIFDPFVQVERRLNHPQEGVGLGLAISRDLARAMGGDLTVSSTPGKGSAFTLRLPFAE